MITNPSLVQGNKACFHYSDAVAWLLGAVIAACAVVTQLHTYINIDLSLHIELAKRVIGGEVLYRDVAEMNPPLVIYLTLPVVYISQFFSLSAPLLLNLVNCALAFLSVLLSWCVVRRNIEYRNPFFRFFFVLFLWFAIFMLPLVIGGGSQFGEKEHIFMLLFLPYLFTYLFSDIERKQRRLFLYSMAILAAIGLNLKPYFFIIPAIIEIYRCMEKRSWFAWVRGENSVIALLSVAYIATIIIATPEFFTLIPLTSLAYPAVAQDMGSWADVVSPSLMLLIIPLLFIMPHQKESSFGGLLKVAFWAALIEYALQFGTWGYLFLPVVTIGILLFSKVIATACEEFVERVVTQKEQLTLANSNQLLPALIYLSVLGLAMVTTLPDIYHNKGLEDNFRIAEFKKLAEDEAVKGKILFLNRYMMPQFPLFSYSEAKWTTPFNSMFLLDGIYSYRLRHKNRAPAVEEKLQKLEDHIRDTMVKAIVNDPPAVIVVYRGERYKDVAYNEYHHLTKVDYIAFLSQSPAFQEEWKHYSLSRIINSVEDDKAGVLARQGYSYAVYSRKD